MEVADMTLLAGPAASDLLVSASVLASPEPLFIVPSGPVDPAHARAAASLIGQTPTVTVLIGEPDGVPAVLVDAVDLCLTHRSDPPRPWVTDATDGVAAAVASAPEAALALVALLRRADDLDPWAGLAAEAATYGLLLGSTAHRRWLAERGPAEPRPHTRPPVAVRRHGERLDIVLDRAEVRNAIDRATRDALVEALGLPLLEPGIRDVHLAGRGPTFSAGGDLHEFGTTSDPATSLAVRLTVHPGWAVHRIADRTTATVHGPCIGAGIEIPAFAAEVRAAPDATFRLPELAMGLVPGAGGTVSISRRIGRHRTVWLCLTGRTIDCLTGLRWGLVDRIL